MINHFYVLCEGRIRAVGPFTSLVNAGHVQEALRTTEACSYCHSVWSDSEMDAIGISLSEFNHVVSASEFGYA